MLHNLFVTPLILSIANKSISFLSIEDFDFFISGRISVPSKKIIEMVRHSTEQLGKESLAIKKIEKRLITVLSHALEKPSSISRSLREIDTSVFSQDHDWREIIIALNNVGKEFDSFRNIVIVKYIQYLSSRQDIIKHLYSEKKAAAGNDQNSATEQEGSARLSETLIFEDDLVDQNSAPLSIRELERMPKGEPITIVLDPNEEITVMLSKYKCSIEADRRFFFIDPSRCKNTLSLRRTTIGREATNNIVVDSTFRDVSRLHLTIEVLGKNSLRLIDFSSHGTYIPSRFLEKYGD